MQQLPTPIQEIKHPLLEEKQITLYVKRDDLIHPEIMGNKWRKLKYNLQKMQDDGIKELVTMGGAFSNHIAAVAAAAQSYSLHAVGIIRGEELHPQCNETLSVAHEKGMKLIFCDRETFREYRDDHVKVAAMYPNHYFLPEGGTNHLAIQGCREIIEEIDLKYDVLVTPIGTGGTLAGLVSVSKQKVLGISALKGDFIHQEIKSLLQTHGIKDSNYEVETGYHFGGYGKTTPELIDFINWFKEKFGIPLDPIYTGKSFFAVWNMIKTDKFEKNLKIILLHTGGLQGVSGFSRKNENIIQ